VPDAELWRSTFPAETLLRPFTPASYDAPTVTPTSQHATAIGTTYEESAKAVAGSRAPADLTADDVVRRQLAQWEGMGAPGSGSRASQPSFSTPDFHRTLSLLREHPAVLREPGLILELSVPVDRLGDGAGAIRVGWPQNPLVVSPLTEYEISAAGFLPGSAGDIVNGMVDLTQPHWATSTVDIDGAVGRLQATAQSVASGASSPTLPALRSGGIALLRQDRHAVLDRARTRGGDATVTAQTSFGTEHLVLGYRVDVRESGGPWRSLSSRRARYTLNGRQAAPDGHVEEGQIKANAITSNGPGAVLEATETVARWSGWSLVVPRPGLGTPAGPSPALPLPFDFRWEFEAEPGSLPSLRYSHNYKSRRWTAHGAGNHRRRDARAAEVLEPHDGGRAGRRHVPHWS
jgi:hypothetical protein